MGAGIGAGKRPGNTRIVVTVIAGHRDVPIGIAGDMD